MPIAMRSHAFRNSFTLKTLLLGVTALAIWLAWQASIVHERKSVATMLRERNLNLDGMPAATSNWSPPAVPWLRSLFGDRSVAEIWLDQSAFSSEEIKRIKTAYPETTFHVVDGSDLQALLSE